MNRVYLAVVVALSLSACGSAITSKQDAANAMQRLGSAASSVDNGSGGGSGFSAGGTVQGKKGTATVSMNASVSGGSTAAGYDIAFHGYSADGNNTYDGTLTVSTSVNVGTNGVQVLYKMKGNVTSSGEYNSTMVVDITETASVTSFSDHSGGQVNVTLDGFVTADGSTYTWNNEAVTVTASKS